MKAAEVQILHMPSVISCCVRNAFSLAIIFASLSTRPAHALIIGEIEVSSREGQPLLAYVPISPERTDEKITTACLSLITSGISPEQERPNLSDARLELEANGDIGQRIRISTSAPVNTRSLTIQLKANCVSHGLVIREFDFELESAAIPSAPAEQVDISDVKRTDNKSALQTHAVPGSEGGIISAPSTRQATKTDSESGDHPSAPLFGDDAPVAEKSPLMSGWKGFAQFDLARMYRDPEHWSNERLRLDLSRNGQFSEDVKWKIGFRLDYDAAYALADYYPQPVRQDQRQEFLLRENYLDISAGDFDYRLGRQHVVWGEMVGVFVADVVSAQDTREFILQDFDVLRIPQWAARAEYFKNDFHAEALWIPVPSFDEIGKPGADFFPYPMSGPGPGGTVFLDEEIPARKLANSNFGLRLSALRNGWDISSFYYHSLDSAPTFFREITAGPAPAFIYQARHEPIDQIGGTLTKDFYSMVLKGELVYTDGRKFNVTDITQADGLVNQNTLDYALGLDFALPAETRLNLQVFQRIFFAYDPDIGLDKRESYASILLNGKLRQKLEAEAMLIHSLNRSDWLFRPRLSWNFERDWRLMMELDVFGGPPTGLFGRFDNNDRAYTEMRYSF